MRTIEVVKVDREVCTSITCNRCECVIERDDRIYENYFAGYYCGGYSSKMGDNTEYQFDLCEPCLILVFKDFSIPPSIEEGY